MNKTPKIIDNLIKEDEFLKLQTYLKANYKDFHYVGIEGRYVNDSNNLPILKDFLNSTIDIVRKSFDNDKLVATDAFFGHYDGVSICKRHKDVYGGTHTLDVVIYQSEIWDIYVEGVPYSLKENQALLFWGGSQLHWRNKLENPNAHVAVIVCHYAEPGHWRHKQEGQE